MGATESSGGVNGLKGEAVRSPAGATGWNGVTTATPEVTDQELVARLREADASALAALYDRYATAVHRLTRGI
jgi:hypothetical protein